MRVQACKADTMDAQITAFADFFPFSFPDYLEVKLLQIPKQTLFEILFQQLSLCLHNRKAQNTASE